MSVTCSLDYLPHHILPPDGESLNHGCLDVAAGGRGAVPDERLLLLPLSHAVRQEVDLDGHTADALLDLSAPRGRRRSIFK